MYLGPAAHAFIASGALPALGSIQSIKVNMLCASSVQNASAFVAASAVSLPAPSFGNIASKIHDQLSRARADSLEGSESKSADAARRFRQSLEQLDARDGERALFERIPNGRAMHLEATIGAVALGGHSDDLPAALARLHMHRTHLVSLEDAGSSTSQRSLDIARVDLARALIILAYADSAREQLITDPCALMRGQGGATGGLAGAPKFESVHELFAKAHDLIIEGMDRLPTSQEAGDDVRNLRLTAKMMRVEAAAAQAVLSHLRRDPNADKRMAFDRLLTSANDLVNEFSRDPAATADERVVEQLASQLAAVSLFFARSGSWRRATELARTLTICEAFTSLPAVRELLNNPVFSRVVDESGTGILSDEALRARQTVFIRAMQWLQAALANAHFSDGLGDKFLSATLGMALGYGVARTMGGEQVTSTDLILGMAGGLALSTTAARFVNGGTSEDARNAFAYGLSERSGTGTGKDALRLFGQGIATGVAGLVPSWFAANGPDFAAMSYHTVGSMLGTYASPFEWLFSLDSYRNLAANISASSNDPIELQAGRALYYAYIASTVGAYTAYSWIGGKRGVDGTQDPGFAQRLRDSIRKYGWAFVPGGVITGAAAAQQILGTEGLNAFLDHAQVAGIGTLEGTLMLLNTGLIALNDTKSVRGVVGSLKDGFTKLNPMNMVAPSIVVGIIAAIGAKAQNDVPIPGDPLMRIAQGMPLTMGLWLYALGVDGGLNRHISPVSGFIQGYREVGGGFAGLVEGARGAYASTFGPFWWNRTRRLMHDMPGAGLAALFGWGSPLGNLLKLIYFNTQTNPWMSRALKEKSGSPFQMEALQDELRTAASLSPEQFDRNFAARLTATNHTIPMFPMFSPLRAKDWMSVLYAIRYTWKPAEYPGLVDGYNLGATAVSIARDGEVSLDADEVRAMTASLARLARDPAHHDQVAAMVQMLTFAGRSGVSTKPEVDAVVADFLANNAWISDLLPVGRVPADLKASMTQRELRSAVAGAFAEQDKGYSRRARMYVASDKPKSSSNMMQP